jgi:hypothetical protein
MTIGGSAIVPGRQQLREKMPECQNCGSHATARYVRVFTPEEFDAPRACPNCPDLTRDGSDVRKKK